MDGEGEVLKKKDGFEGDMGWGRERVWGRCVGKGMCLERG